MRRRGRWLLRGLALVLAAVVAVLLAELVLRRWTPEEAVLAGVEWQRGTASPMHPQRGIYMLDEELGFRPVRGGEKYSEHGTLWNEYALEKPEGVRRLLFLGDSVTRRGKIVGALRELLGEEGLEYWNAGVEAYATAQEVRYYEQHLLGLDEDHLVLTFHLNDFETTPILFLDAGDRLVGYNPRKPTQGFARWLFRHSYLYRLLVGLSLQTSGYGVEPEVEAEIEQAIRRLVALTDEREVELTVLLLPLMLPLESWPPGAQARRARITRLLESLSIRHFDLVPALERALGDGVEVRSQGRDPQHPSHAFAEYAARYLREAGFRP
jgi:hypothetical protein